MVKKSVILFFMIVIFVCTISFFVVDKKYVNNKKLYNSFAIEEYDKYIEEVTDKNEFYKYSIIDTLKIDEDSINDIDLKDIENSVIDIDRKLEELKIKQKELEELNAKIVKEYDDKKYELYKKETTFIIKNFPKLNQYSIGYPTGCESAALTLLLKYYGVNVSIKDVVNKLPKGEKPHYENGVRYGGNPEVEFIGDPTDSASYGVYEKPIVNIANSFKGGIINGTGMSFESVLEVVKSGRPVIVWVTSNLKTPTYGNRWIYKETNQVIEWIGGLHALNVIGYTDNQVITSDTLTGTIRYFNKNTFKNRYNSLGKRAIYY